MGALLIRVSKVFAKTQYLNKFFEGGASSCRMVARFVELDTPQVNLLKLL